MVAIAVARRDARAVGPLDLDLDRRLDQAERHRRQVEAGDHAGLAGDQRRLGAGLGRHDRLGGDVAGAAEILQQGGADQRLDHRIGNIT